jgi:hypothetical protein
MTNPDFMFIRQDEFARAENLLVTGTLVVDTPAIEGDEPDEAGADKVARTLQRLAAIGFGGQGITFGLKDGTTTGDLPGDREANRKWATESLWLVVKVTLDGEVTTDIYKRKSDLTLKDAARALRDVTLAKARHEFQSLQRGAGRLH